MKTRIGTFTLIIVSLLLPAQCLTGKDACTQTVPESLSQPSSYLTPFEKMMRNQLKSYFSRRLKQRAEPTISFAEELVLWSACTLSLYALGRLKLGKKIMIPALALDSMLAYSQYPLYKSLGSYPSLEYVGVPSITLLGTIGLSKLWKKARSSLEHHFLDEHKSMLEIAQCAQNKELTSEDLNSLETHFNDLKNDLIERGMYKYLYLAGARVSDCMTHLEELQQMGHVEDFHIIFNMIELTHALQSFVGS